MSATAMGCGLLEEKEMRFLHLPLPFNKLNGDGVKAEILKEEQTGG